MLPSASADEFFQVLAYLVSSAGNASHETLALASFRMMDAMSRLVSLAEKGEPVAVDAFLLRAREQFHEHFGEIMWDEPAFLTWVSQLDAEFVVEARRRGLATE